MNTTPGTSSSKSDAIRQNALTECLRIFARRGAELRTSATRAQQSGPATTPGVSDVCTPTPQINQPAKTGNQ